MQIRCEFVTHQTRLDSALSAFAVEVIHGRHSGGREKEEARDSVAGVLLLVCMCICLWGSSNGFRLHLSLTKQPIIHLHLYAANNKNKNIINSHIKLNVSLFDSIAEPKATRSALAVALHPCNGSQLMINKCK